MKCYPNIQSLLLGKEMFLLILALSLYLPSSAQVNLQVGGSVVGELSRAGGGSHFYYNGIDAGFTDWRVGPKEVNLLARLGLPKSFSLDTRLLLTRDRGQEFNRLILARLQLNWRHPRQRWSLHAGRIQTPFGAFYDRPLPQDRDFITPPLPYGYFTNISPRVGYSEALREPNLLFGPDGRDWGLPLAYELGYTSGIHAHWDIIKDSLSMDLALVQQSPNLIDFGQERIHPTLMWRLNWQPTYFWKQGFSLSYGGFMQEDSLNQGLNLNAYRQLLLGSHASLGYTYFQWRAEVVAAWFRVPEYDAGLQEFTNIEGSNYFSLSAYMDLKAEMPFWAGAYLAYRLGYLGFPTPGGSSWDDRVLRHSFSLGIPFSRNILWQNTIAIQEVKGKDWDLGQFRSNLILYF